MRSKEHTLNWMFILRTVRYHRQKVDLQWPVWGDKPLWHCKRWRRISLYRTISGHSAATCTAATCITYLHSMKSVLWLSMLSWQNNGSVAHRYMNDLEIGKANEECKAYSYGAQICNVYLSTARSLLIFVTTGIFPPSSRYRFRSITTESGLFK